MSTNVVNVLTEAMAPEIVATIEALKSVRNPRYLATERGFQGAFYCALWEELECINISSKERLLEMEYQKSGRRHGTAQRPDIVFHIPTEISRASVRDNNYAVWALKSAASKACAQDDFAKLDIMCCQRTVKTSQGGSNENQPL